MGKKSKKAQSLDSLASNCSPILELKYKQPLFAVLCHPEEPILLSGLATGHILCHKYDAPVLEKFYAGRTDKGTIEGDFDKEKPWAVVDIGEDGITDVDGLELVWKTRRHKGSVRSMCFGDNGKYLYSVGIDNVLKKAATENGKVVKKTTLSNDSNIKYTKVVKSLTHPLLLVGDEDGNVIVLDSETLEVKNSIRKIHNGDAINDIFQFSGKSVYKFISLGQTTLAYWDARKTNEDDLKLSPDDTESKRSVALSDDQEDEILCGTFVNPEDGEILVCGMGEGVLTLWKPKKNDLVDQISRIKIKKNESLDCIVPTLQDDNCIWTGCSDGQIYKVNVKTSKVVEIRKHSNLDEVSFLDLDFEYRLVSGGMDKVKIWQFKDEDEPLDSGNEDDFHEGNSITSSSDSSSDEESEENNASSSQKDSNSEEEEDDGDDDDDDEEVWSKLNDRADQDSEASGDDSGCSIGLSREELLQELDKDFSEDDEEAKKRTLDTAEARPTKKAKKMKQKQLTSKQLRNLQRNEHGIKKFEDL
ncbi:LAFE_0G17854g1_1 [Lachancea fermentati]|uniref:LAFE_0G17854g1_1 n=1 Tax=Lachancea fermentati TaxID=4955 RepID=A0A1G4MIS1_LACFM|nr:LAFE_0G17854g1_1 [Lachancea fermentati]